MFEDSFSFWLLIIALFSLWIWIRRVRREAEAMRADIQKVLDAILFMRIENHGETLYAYNALTGEFICQGKDLAELNQIFAVRFPQSKGVIVEPIEKLVPLKGE